MKHENIFRKLARWFVRSIFGLKFEEKWFHINSNTEKAREITYKNGVPDDSELIVSPTRQIFNRFMERKFAVFSVFVVVAMFLVVFIVPHFMYKYYDAYTETTLKDLPPTFDLMSVPNEMKDQIKSIDSYSGFTVGLSQEGKVYVWGAASFNATGVNLKKIPQEVRDAKIAFVSAGFDHIIAIGEDGKFYGWGNNRFGQYDIYDADKNLIQDDNIANVPDDVYYGRLDVSQIKRVTSGYQASAILMKDGTLYIWGNMKTYDNLINFIANSEGEPKKGFVDIDFTLSKVVTIDETQSTINTTGAVSKRKKNRAGSGLFGAARTSISGEGVDLSTFLDGRKINEIRATQSSICLLLDDGSIALSGDFKDDDNVEVPVLEDGEYFIDIEGGNYHYSGVTNLGHVYSFGGDHYYQATAPDLEGAAKIYTGAFQNYAVDANGKLLKTWGLSHFLFGTDEAGANIAERVIAGGRVTMTVGAVAVIIEIIIGVSIGLLSGFLGGWVDIFLMRVAEVFSSIPLYPFLLILSSLLAQAPISEDAKLYMIMVILGVLGWPGFAYVTRAQVLVAREAEYVTAAQAMGVKTRRIAFSHILPNIISVILVNMTLSFAASMQTETSLSFLGFGVIYPRPSWGNMLTRASDAVAAINFPWQWIFTSVILILTTICINTIGDTLRDVMDPKSTNDK